MTAATGSLAHRAARTLDELGPTPDDVADRLRALGIKGDRGSSCACPIALILRAVDGVEDADVLETIAEVWDKANPDAAAVEVHVPQPVSEFIVRFDKGVYLDLVATPGDAANRQAKS